MKELYDLLGISRQAHHQQVAHQQEQAFRLACLRREVQYIRKEHPKLGLRKVWHLLNPMDIGRDRFEEYMLKGGLGVKRKKNFRRTTYAHPSLEFPNLLSGRVITNYNQAWVSDITYLESGPSFYYLTFITDVYTRKVVGYTVSDHLGAAANVAALQMAIQNQRALGLDELIHHSDRGTQYCSNNYLQLLRDCGIRISMGNKAWENAHAERMNGIIKNEYLAGTHQLSLKCLQQEVDKAVYKYNYIRPHGQLPHKRNPVAFESYAIKNKLNYTVKINY